MLICKWVFRSLKIPCTCNFCFNFIKSNILFSAKSCLIPDVRDNTVLSTGSTRGTYKYDAIIGTFATLPGLRKSRINHGCGGYFDADERFVSLKKCYENHGIAIPFPPFTISLGIAIAVSWFLSLNLDFIYFGCIFCTFACQLWLGHAGCRRRLFRRAVFNRNVYFRQRQYLAATRGWWDISPKPLSVCGEPW